MPSADLPFNVDSGFGPSDGVVASSSLSVSIDRWPVPYGIVFVPKYDADAFFSATVPDEPLYPAAASDNVADVALLIFNHACRRSR
jgi:hypothetical protein